MIFELTDGENLELKTIVVDLNGSLSVYGKVPEGVHEQIQQLKILGFRIVLLSGDVRGNAKIIADNLEIELIVAKNSAEKEQAILGLEPETCVSIGNARIDIGTFKQAKISIVTVQAEGIHAEVLQYADIVVPSIGAALNLFLDKEAFIATMRK
ncbi:MAG: hypothetical protein AAB373_03535 [Patescibacteria group bacterium]